MGTNYYAIPKLTDEIKAKAIKAIQDDNIGLAKSILPENVHIGKSSAGWAFLFNHNDYNYYKNVSEMIEWLKGCEIYDEYGRDVSHEEFISMVEEKQKTHKCKMTNPEWYVFDGEFVFSSSTEFS